MQQLSVAVDVADSDGRPLLRAAGDFEAEQSLTMGTFLAGAIPFGSPLRHYTPYATRSAGPAAKTVRTETAISIMMIAAEKLWLVCA